MKPLTPIRTSLLITAALATTLGARETERHVPSVPIPRHREARQEGPPSDPADTVEFPAEFRSTNGQGNNIDEPTLGAAKQAMRRVFEADYADGAESPTGADRPSARAISSDGKRNPGGAGFLRSSPTHFSARQSSEVERSARHSPKPLGEIRTALASPLSRLLFCHR